MLTSYFTVRLAIAATTIILTAVVINSAKLISKLAHSKRTVVSVQRRHQLSH